jgi:hypothetical protein
MQIDPHLQVGEAYNLLEEDADHEYNPEPMTLESVAEEAAEAVILHVILARPAPPALNGKSGSKKRK